MNPFSHKRQNPTKPWLMGLIACVLVAAQWLALAHQVRHAPGLTAAAASGHQADGGHDAGSGECRLTDQAGLADALHGALVPTLPQLPGATAPCAVAGRGHAAAQASAYLARAPPSA